MKNEKLIINSDFGVPEYQSELVINEGLVVKFVKPAPNAWFRFWTNIMLGWQWRSLTKRALDGVGVAPHCEHGWNGLCPVCDACQTPPRQ